MQSNAATKTGSEHTSVAMRDAVAGEGTHRKHVSCYSIQWTPSNDRWLQWQWSHLNCWQL